MCISCSRLNILYHHRTQGKGVEGVHIREIIKAWERQGCKVDIVGPPGISVWDEEGVSKNKNLLVGIYYKYVSKCVPELIFEFLEIFYNFFVSRRLKKALTGKHYTFIYERYSLFNWSGIKEAKKAKIPVILEVNYTNHTPLYRKRSKVLKPLTNRIEEWVFKNAHGIVVVSTYLKEHLLRLGIDKEKIIVLTNAADPEIFSPAVSAQEIKDKYKLNGKILVGFVGGFYPWHGLDNLLKVFAGLAKDYNNADMLLIGDGPMWHSLKESTIKLGLENRIHFAGAVSHDKLPKYIATFNIAVMPDSNEYGSPMKIYEYMAMSKPVVAPRLEPLVDGITHGREGLLFEPGNINELSNALKKLLGKENLRIQMGRLGREKILRKCNWRKNAEAIITLNHRIVDSRKIGELMSTGGYSGKVAT